MCHFNERNFICSTRNLEGVIIMLLDYQYSNIDIYITGINVVLTNIQ